MDSILFWFIALFGVITIYRMLSRRVTTPKARVAAMLRQYHALAKTGLSEAECMFRLLATRPGWKDLPHGFLSEIIRRLGSKEDVMRFISLAEDYRQVKERLPEITNKAGVTDALADVACLLARLGYPLQQQGRLKEAEFVQRLALALAPDCYYTNLPLAATYFEAGRLSDAKPLFERGLAQFEKNSPRGVSSQSSSLTTCLGPEVDGAKLKESYLNMYNACVKGQGSKGA
jgi:tetratricopeptide (TPR) repeat protein